MKKILIICLAVLFCFTVQTTFAQIPIQVLVQISKAEDELRYDKRLEDLMMNPNEKIRERAALAAGRIGNERAVPMLTNLLLNDAEDIRATAAFAFGEIESIKATDTILANTLSRLRSKIANEKLRAMLLSDNDPIARANAARALGAAEDTDAFNLLLESAVSDQDSRVRVSAIRSLASLKDVKAADRLLTRGENLLVDYKKSKFANPNEKNELLEIATTLGRILPSLYGKPNVYITRAREFLENLLEFDDKSPEIYLALAKVTVNSYVVEMGSTLYKYSKPNKTNWLTISGSLQGMGELTNVNEIETKTRVDSLYAHATEQVIDGERMADFDFTKAIPDVLRTYAKFKTKNLVEVLRGSLKHKDTFVRATAAELLGEQPANKENVEALKTAFAKSLKTDKQYNDAQLAILSALVKLDKKEAIDSLKLALDSPNFLLRRHAAQLIKQNDLQASFPNAYEKVGTVKPYNRKTGTKLGQVLNTNADYLRAVSRRNAKAILTTEKGTFTIEFFPEDAPLTVDNFIKLARRNYFNGLAIHRVVPNFVMQDGDPRGDGNGGPGWEIRDEINMVEYERGMVGMALSGKDTGGSQWFVTHSPQPHLDGGYTVFGRVNETDMKIVDNLVRGDKILSVKIVEGKLPVKKGK
ncbi:MAG: peptidylprolyl isomerase [Acidobacteria bacterium]|nr:peptidylprolyl isomerase [Acidobacteriota bacterium]